MRHRVLLVAAARPNFMKIAPIWHALADANDICEPVLVHTGQHYDRNMSDVFFRDLDLPEPAVHLGVGGGTHAEQTAGVMVEFEKICLRDLPRFAVVVGDVNSTMACAIAAKKLGISVAHVEAGLRSRDWRMPEEINRIVTDAISDLLLTPSPDASENLLREGIEESRIRFVGNVMIDSLVRALAKANGREPYQALGLSAGQYGLVTLHRPSNVDDASTLAAIIEALCRLEVPIVFPVHPRTRKVLQASQKLHTILGQRSNRLFLLEPMPYYDFVAMTRSARFVVTDSGGIQEETTFLGIPCLTLRPNTERPITIDKGTNELATLSSLPKQLARIERGEWKRGATPELWDGRAGHRVAAALLEALS